MSPKRTGLGELELEVMKALWERPRSSVQEIAEVMSKRRGCARTTVLTVMQRLHAKGFLRRRKVDGVFRYWPTKERGTVLSSLIEQFLERVLNGSAAPFLAHLMETKGLTEDQIEQLQALAKELERNKGEQ